MKERIAKVTTEINYNGDIRELKDFLIKHKDSFIRPPIKEEKRDIPSVIRGLVIKRSRGRCERCGDHGEQIHHKKPICAGGMHVLKNLEFLCLKCHHLTFREIDKIKIVISNEREGEVFINGKRSKEKK